MEFHHLNLISPLFYRESGDEEILIQKNKKFLSGQIENGEEKIFCYELDEHEFLNFDPDKEKLIKKLIFCGNRINEAENEKEILKKIELPKGFYLFSQNRKLLNREEIMDLVIEVQKESLWQKLKPCDLFYLRFLFEDNSIVTQIFRPCDGEQLEL